MGEAPQIRLRRMVPADLESVNALGIRSKASWLYTPSEMEIFAGELTHSVESLDGWSDARVALTAPGDLAGYFSLRRHGFGDIELEHLFVDPRFFGSGIGSRLLEAAQGSAAALGASEITIVSDPNAEGFYLKRGARQVGQHRSSIPGRQIPILKLELE